DGLAAGGRNGSAGRGAVDGSDRGGCGDHRGGGFQPTSAEGARGSSGAAHRPGNDGSGAGRAEFRTGWVMTARDVQLVREVVGDLLLYSARFLGSSST